MSQATSFVCGTVIEFSTRSASLEDNVGVETYSLCIIGLIDGYFGRF